MSNDKSVRIVTCPNCRKPTEWRVDNPYRPFCSERCKLIDIGAWASESYRVAGSEVAPESDDQGYA